MSPGPDRPRPDRLRVIGTESPLAGLRRRRLGSAEVLAQSIAAVAPSAAAVTLPGIVVGLAGGATVAAFVAAAIVTILVGSSITVFARRMASAGGIYSYVAKALGPAGGFTTGWSVMIGYAGAAMASAFGGGVYLARLLGLPERGPAVATTVLVVSAMAGALMIRGIKVSARVSLVLEVLSVGLLITILLTMLVSRPAGGGHGPGPAPTFDGFALGALLAVTAFVGFESSATLAAESRRPFLSVPRALLWTPVGLAVLFVGAAAVQTVLFQGQPASLLSGGVPVADLARLQDRDVLGYLLDLGIFTSWLACLMGSSNALVRVLFSMGREGVCPGWLGSTHPRFGTPAHAIVVAVPVVGLVPLVVLSLEQSGFDVFVDLLTLAGYGYLVSYALVSVAAPVFLRRVGELTLVPVVIGVGSFLAIVFLVVWTLAAHGFGGGGLGIAYAAVMAVGWLRLGYLALRDRAVLDSVGIYDEPVTADLLLVGDTGTEP